MHLALAILSRNRPDCLERALEAVSACSDRPDSIIVSDDSDADAASQVQALVRRYAGVAYTKGPRAGLGANENHVVRNLPPQADWVVFIGDDARPSEQFVATLRAKLRHYQGQRVIPTGSEWRNGVWVEPNDLDFLGFQSVRYADYRAGAPVRTVVVQATPFPVGELQNLSWLEVSTYGYDEVDMAAKFRRLGWSFRYEPEIWLHHDQSEVGRSAYPEPAQIARLYYRLRSFSVYEHRPWALVAFLLIAPVHLALSLMRDRDWAGLRRVPHIVQVSYGRWFRSLRGDWRLG